MYGSIEIYKIGRWLFFLLKIFKVVNLLILILLIAGCIDESQNITLGENSEKPVYTKKTLPTPNEGNYDSEGIIKNELAIADNKDHELWNQTVKEYLQDDLWIDRDIYDSAHILMTPLHAAFKLSELDWQNDFAEHFKRFSNEIVSKNNNVSNNKLNRLQYLYLYSQFLVLAESEEKQELIPDNTKEILLDELELHWKEPAWLWGREPFSSGMAERLNWKLNNKNVPKSYYRAIFDEELFMFAIAADVRSYEKLTTPENLWSPLVTEILSFSAKVFNKEVEFNEDGGWLFQPGVWSEHPDYAYVGHTEKIVGMKMMPRKNISMDSSHSHRFPLWLSSLSNAYKEDSQEKEYYEKLLEGLKYQFLNKVIVNPTSDFSGYRINNFMDGWNGIYRWGYSTQGENNGYGPYEQSGTLIEGWWGFLESPQVSSIFKDMSNLFPLEENVVKLYVGPNTTRERHPLATWPNYFINGFGELNVRLMTKLMANKD